ncbi:MAG: hypothetical protein JOZ42_03020 [Acetobacteraceae bacterium]|nr:hypothetical protein [Acetobacteraceae bacterium]
MTDLRQGTGRGWPEREEASRAIDRWVSEDLTRRHGDACTEDLPDGWLSLIAAAERGGEGRRREARSTA